MGVMLMPSMQDPVIISAALTGSTPMKSQNAGLPVTEEEIAEAALACWNAGAAIVHLHVRDEYGKMVCDPERFARAKALIEDSGADVIINLSTSGGPGNMDDAHRLGPLALKPELASFDCGSLNFGRNVFINSPTFLDMLSAGMTEHGVVPEIECFEAGHITTAIQLMQEGKLKPPYWFQMVLGVRGGAPGTVKQLVHMVDMLPAEAIWSCCGIGRAQLPLNLATIAMGGHVRTGLEDNIYYHKGILADSNAQLVERVVRIANEVGRPVATPDEARAIIGLAPRKAS
jgi:3-keto-5-aminohexanoate cleavage enzyme